MCITFDPSILLLGIYSREILTNVKGGTAEGKSAVLINIRKCLN